MIQANADFEHTHGNKVAILQKIPGMSLCCRDIGLNCSYEINGSSSREIMKIFIDHAKTAHNMQVLSADVIFRVQNAIKK